MGINHSCLLGAAAGKGETAKWFQISSAARKVISARYKMLNITSDFNRPPRDCITARGFWTMEEYQCFTETWSVIVFQPEVVPGGRGRAESETHVLYDARLRAMWRHIRQVVLLMCRPHEGDVEETASEVSTRTPLPL